MLRAVLFDFSDTLFWRAGAERIHMILQREGIAAERSDLERLWVDIKKRSVTADELAKHRDSTQEAHRRCWVELLRPFDVYMPKAAETFYEDQPNPEGWRAFPDTVEVLRVLGAHGVPIGVVSDIGWDLRPIFQYFGVADLIQAWVLSYEHGTEKPDPKLFLLGCEQLQASASETLMVGDSVEKDGGAANAGLVSLTLPTHPGHGERGLRHVLRLFGSA